MAGSREMEMITRNIYINSKQVCAPIYIVYGTSNQQIQFCMKDVTLASGNTATFYCLAPNNQRYSAAGTIDTSAGTITFTPAAGFFVTGDNLLQCEITQSSKKLYNFAADVICERNVQGEGTPSEAVAAASYAERAEAAAETAESVLESIPQDYSALSDEVEDIRIGADGTTYQSAGAAVRGQVEDLENDIAFANEILGVEVTETPGYYNADGSIAAATSTRLEVYTQKIPVKCGTTIHIELTYDATEPPGGMWGRYVLYDSSETFISGSAVTFVNAMTVSFTQDITITTASAAYISFSYRTFGIHTFRYENLDLEELKTMPEMMELPITETEGYYGTGAYITPPDSSRKEVYTQKYPAYNGMTFQLELTYPGSSAVAMYCNYVLFDDTGMVLQKTDLINEMTVRKVVSLTISHDDAAYISFSYRTYGTHAIRIKCSDYWKCFTDGFGYLNAITGTQHYAVNENINSINHRGYTFAPENTLPAYRLSKQKGFKMVECDVMFTSDNVPVLLHDATINRTARNADGTTISSTIAIADITFEQAQAYDFGIWKGAQWAGTKIPSLEQFIVLCRNIGLHPYIELKSSAAQQAKVNQVVDIVKNCGMADKCTWVSYGSGILGWVINRNPKARVGYLVNTVTSAAITEAQNLMTGSADVFICSASKTDVEITLCKNADIPMEAFNFSQVSDILALDPYISGVTSDNLVAGYVLYQNNISNT